MPELLHSHSVQIKTCKISVLHVLVPSQICWQTTQHRQYVNETLESDSTF